MGFLLRVWVIKTIHVVETHWLSGKEKVLGTAVCKEGNANKQMQQTYRCAQKEDKSTYGGARCVMVIVLGNGHGDTSSNPVRDWLHFT